MAPRSSTPRPKALSKKAATPHSPSKGRSPSPAKRGKDTEQSADAPSSIAEGFFTRLPPLTCALALGVFGLHAALSLWGSTVKFGDKLAPVTVFLAVTAGVLVSLYYMKAVIATSAFLQDASEPVNLVGMATASAVTQGLAAKFSYALAPTAAPSIVVVCEILSILIAARFVLLSYRKGAYPDPSWFPACLLCGMTNMTTQAVGPAWLRDLMPYQFWALIAVYIPLKLVVVHRLFISKARNSVAPNAGMNLLMAPGSFFTMMHFNSGAPGGTNMGMLLFADSTLFFLVTLWMLYKRRELWANSFHPSYVAFTFPVASTASAAVLASQNLPLLQGDSYKVATNWATLVVVVALFVVTSVMLRFLWYLYVDILPRPRGAGKRRLSTKRKDKDL
eukprot:TRINITY_DN32118_c0_g1_i1.p1 TRINITY_DN32118_c0_g1~~TRINITY_DN32118_c0_g1_i1.p1  ORF type:complete len:391 (+),score=55.94 TRINITY_DN32118_c0_g1_i1:94-1266(+)